MSARNGTLRILVVRTRYPHWGRYTGIHQFLRYLPAGRYAVEERVVNDGDEDFPVRADFIRTPLRRLVQRNGMAWYKLSDLAAETAAAAAATAGRLDLLHYLDGEHSAQYLPGRARWLSRGRTRIVATFHQPPEELEKLVRREVVRRLDAVTLVAETQRPFFEGLLPSDRIEVIPHGIDTEVFRPADGPAESGVFRCISVGHYLRDYAAVRGVAERLAHDSSVQFDVVSARETGLENLPNVIHHRGLFDEDLVRLYQRAHVLLLPLLASTANNALLEGIACGLPVVSTALPAVKTYLPGEEALLVERNDPDMLIEMLQRLRHDPGEWKRRSGLARARAEVLSWSRIAPRFDQWYGRVLA